jgi:CheY-like chemotaxis protein
MDGRMSIEERLADNSLEAAESNPERPRPKVLVVDNERVIADTLAMILSLLGYERSVAYNGSEGLRKAREFKPDMIISDVIHDPPNGIDMAIQILVEMPETRILLFSGQAAYLDPFLEDARAKGHELKLVAKPVAPNALAHWLEFQGRHDVRSCNWCREQRASSKGAYPHGKPGDCTCPWCRPLSDED